MHRGLSNSGCHAAAHKIGARHTAVATQTFVAITSPLMVVRNFDQSTAVEVSYYASTHSTASHIYVATPFGLHRAAKCQISKCAGSNDIRISSAPAPDTANAISMEKLTAPHNSFSEAVLPPLECAGTTE